MLKWLINDIDINPLFFIDLGLVIEIYANVAVIDEDIFDFIWLTESRN
jgi:hypothetical protein